MMNFERFGGRRALLTLLGAQARDILGVYRPMRDLDWGSLKRPVFICKGNICRSPYAQARVNALGLDSVSFGMDTTDQVPANDTAIRVASERGLKLDAHRARQLRRGELGPGDLAVFFEPAHLESFRKLDPGHRHVTLLGLWGDARRPFIADPYGKSVQYFHECFSIIDRSASALVTLMRGRA
jgi:protein-tyrosine phosphatase